jgi:hypothetical protein
MSKDRELGWIAPGKHAGKWQDTHIGMRSVRDEDWW